MSEIKKESFDVAVVGAGLAGSLVAKTTAEAGISTVVLERKRKVGTPVLCGELVPHPREIRDMFPNSARGSRLTQVSKEFVTNRTKRIRLVSPRGNAFEFDFRANIVDRSSFDSWLAETALDSGAELELGCHVSKRNNENILHLLTEKTKQTISADIVVGADGVSSVIGRSMGRSSFIPEADISHSMQYTMENVEVEPDVVEMYFGNRISPGGYAWVIPKGDDLANIGLGLRRTYSDESLPLREYLRNFVFRYPGVRERMRNGRIVSRIGALIPVGGPVKRTFSHNTLLVGDAAGHVMASNGGGIPTALIGGEIAGESIIKYLNEGVQLDTYENTWKYEFGHELMTALSILQIANQVMPSDSLTDQCMRLARVNYLESLIRCRLPLLVDWAAKTFVKILRQIE